MPGVIDVSKVPLLFGACVYGWPPPSFTQTWAKVEAANPTWAAVKDRYPEWIYVRNDTAES